MNRRLTLWIDHPTIGRAGTVEPYWRFDAAIKWCDLGKWSLRAPLAGRNALLLDRGAAIVAVDPQTGRVVCSGPVVRPHVTVDGTRRILTVDGVTDEHVLSDRAVWPVPTAVFGDQAASEHHTITGEATSVIASYAHLQAGDAALLSGSINRRQQLHRTVSGGGATITGHGRFQNLLEFLRGLAAAGGVGFYVTRDADLSRRLIVTTSTDKSATIRLSPTRYSIATGEFWRNAPGATAVLIAGQGEGTARQTFEFTDGAAETAWGRRVESFLDKRSEPDYTKLYQDAAKEFHDNGETAAVKFQARDVKGAVCGVDYWLGDIIRADLVDGLSVTAGIVEIDVTQGKFRPQYQAVIGEGGATNTPRAKLDVQRLFSRVRNLERR